MTRPATIPEALFATAARGTGEYVFHFEGGIARFSCAELAERAQRGARCLVALGVEPGDTVGLLGPNRPEWVVWAFATWIAGAALVPVQVPLRIRDSDAFRERLRSLVEAAGCRHVVADPDLAAHLPPGVAVAWDETGDATSEEPAGPAPDGAAVVQFTSGSTAKPKGALLTHAAVMAQVADLLGIYRYDDGAPRSVLSWTPFFHDLGLFPNLIQPAFSGAIVHQLPTERFARDPAEWLRLVERTRAAVTAGPSSAFGSALRAVGRREEWPDLSSLEVAYFGAEVVDPGIAGRMVEMAGDLNLDPMALGVAYGLAEAVMAVSYSTAGSGIFFDRVSLRELGGASVAAPAGNDPARVLVSCGPPLMDLRIVAADGAELPERHIGEIQLRGPSLMSGYVGVDAPDPFVNGWLRTGDLGYLAGGELYVTGREKDVMIVMGQNYYPEDFEWAAGRVDGVRPGRCLAFNPPGADGAVVLVEARDGEAPARIQRDVARAIADTVGVSPDEVLVLAPGTVEKTTSGKLRRAAMRDAYIRGEMTNLAA